MNAWVPEHAHGVINVPPLVPRVSPSKQKRHVGSGFNEFDDVEVWRLCVVVLLHPESESLTPIPPTLPSVLPTLGGVYKPRFSRARLVTASLAPPIKRETSTC